MLGVFDSGHGGLTIMAELTARFPARRFVYFGDHAHAPYGEKPGPAIVAHTQAALEALFARGCKLVLLGCNTASAAAARTLQHEWLPAHYPRHRVLGIIAPTVEVATQTPWSVKAPVFPQKYNADTLAIFGTAFTIASGVFETEVAKRCPRARVIGQACPQLVPLLERGAPEAELRAAVETYVYQMLETFSSLYPLPSTLHPGPEWAILGCTHYPLIAHLFRQALPPQTRILNQPKAVADALEDYFTRHPEFDTPDPRPQVLDPIYLTSGNPAEVSRVAERFTGQKIAFTAA